MSDGFFIQEIEDENYIKSIAEVEGFIDDIITYGQYIFGLISAEENKKFSDTSILLLFRESLEILDGIKSLVKGSSFNVIEILLRNLFENMIYFDYIFKDDKLIEKKALAYDIECIHKKIDLYKKLNKNSNSKDCYRVSIGEDFVEDYDTSELDNKIKNLESIFSKYNEYKQVNLDRKNKKNKIEKSIRKKSKKDVNINLKWYQVYGSSNNFRELCREVEMEKEYLIIYKGWSDKVHVGSASEGFYIEDSQAFIRNPKIPKDITTVPNTINFSLTFLVSIFKNIIDYFLQNEDKKNMIDWYVNMKERRDKLSNYWQSIKFVAE